MACKGALKRGKVNFFIKYYQGVIVCASLSYDLYISALVNIIKKFTSKMSYPFSVKMCIFLTLWFNS